MQYNLVMKDKQIWAKFVLVALIFTVVGFAGGQFYNKVGKRADDTNDTIGGDSDNGTISITVTPYPSSDKKDSSESKPGAKIEVVGVIDCLPHKGNGPSTMECAFGLKSTQGKYYGLINLNEEDMMSGKITTGVEVKVTGKLNNDEKSNYDIVGVIDVSSLVVI